MTPILSLLDMLLFNQVNLIFQFYFAFQSLLFCSVKGYKTSKLTLSHLMTAKDDRKTETGSKGCCALHRLETWRLLAVTADAQMHIQLEPLSITNAACVGCPSCYYDELTVGGRMRNQGGRKTGPQGTILGHGLHRHTLQPPF